MQANKALTQIISFDSIDQTDDTFYLIAACNPHDDIAGIWVAFFQECQR